jgi:hypothetical protein
MGYLGNISGISVAYSAVQYKSADLLPAGLPGNHIAESGPELPEYSNCNTGIPGNDLRKFRIFLITA